MKKWRQNLFDGGKKEKNKQQQQQGKSLGGKYTGQPGRNESGWGNHRGGETQREEV